MARASLLWLVSASFPAVARTDLTVLAIGDWGGGSDEEPSTLSQRLTAKGMLRKAQEHHPDFALLMGDNFYQHGIHECAETTTRFQDTFEDVYTSLLPNMPFYALAGNHDYGEGRLANISAQLEYSRFSKQWRFPALWYKIHREFQVGNETRLLEVMVLDTVVLCGNGAENEDFVDEQLRSLGRKAPRRDDQPGDLRRSVAEEQWTWLEAELSASTADFLWVTGHYPIWSAGNDGSSACLIERLRPMLLKHGAHYISGHDHMLEHFEHRGLNTFVAGAGKECCYPPVNLRTTPAGAMRYMLAGKHGALSRPQTPFPVQGGFASLRFGAEFVTVSLHADNGSALYTAQPIPRRSRAITVDAAMLSTDVLLLRIIPLPVEAMLFFPFVMFALAAWAVFQWGRRARLPAVSTEPLLA